MKIKQTSDQWRVTSDACHGAHPGHASRVTRHDSAPCHPSPVPRHSQSGIALVITLIMLSVTLVMAVAFLAIARRERGAVTTTTDTTTARLAAESALAQAQAQIIANIFTSTNRAAYNYSLLVSTNFINAFGYSPGFQNPTNVNYDYLYNNTLFTANDRIQNIANLYFLPRAPVYVTTNRATGSNDFRFFLDLNRNRQYEGTGTNISNVEIAGGLVVTNGTISVVGDPEWVGVLERPDQPHGPNNLFMARYAFFAQPIGNSLDLNHIHNQTLNPNLSAADGFLRNEGVGSWELNLAAFLADLNTNQWNPPTLGNVAINPYRYQQPGFANSGAAFEDARALLSWRYAYNYNLLAIPPLFAYNALVNAGIDGYTVGSVMTNTFLSAPLVPINQHWAGSDNTNRFFALPSDLFDAGKNLGNFSTHLLAAGTNIATYDRYTFYRMMDELGTDSAPLDDRMNLNYRNVTNGVVVAGMETNFIPWTALEFFTNAADRMLRQSTANWFAAAPTNYLVTYYGILPNTYVAPDGYGLTNIPLYGMTNQVPAFGIGNIPVWVYDQSGYSSAVNRLLQLAANMYDASTNQTALLGKDYPSVFRPTFWVTNQNGFRNVYINGYVDISLYSKSTGLAVGTAPLDLPTDLDHPSLAVNAPANMASGNAYGVPWIIGAKKGLPGFNELYMRNAVQLTRKLQVTRTDVNTPGAVKTNEMFVMSITNRLGFSFWNSYNTNYFSGNNLTVYFHDFLSMGLTNTAAKSWQFFYGNPATLPLTFITNLTAWTGSYWTNSGSSAPENQSAAPESFIAGVYDFPFLPQSIYRWGLADFERVSLNPAWETNYPSTPVFPQFGLLTTNRVQAFILDGNHVIDYVQLSGPNGSRSLSAEINDPIETGGHRYMWSTNQDVNGAIWGVRNQISVSRNPGLAGITAWKKPTDMPQGLNSVTLEGQYFDAFFTGGSVIVGTGKNQYLQKNTNSAIQVPYTPTRTAWDFILWQANDPLVHYIASDLSTTTRETGWHRSDNLVNTAFPAVSLTSAGARYQPWGRNQQMAFLGESVVDTNMFNLRFRDPLVWGSDYWDFPTGKYPTVGWLGRVHRGTPWQTVFLKYRNVLDETINTPDGLVNIGTNTWAHWTGDTQTVFNQQYDAANSAPVRDSDLFDLFTTQFNDNATRGTLSVNQTHLAAWSAVFSGLVALTNITDFPASYTAPMLTNFIVSPAGVAGNSSALGLLVNGTAGINATRATFTNADGLVGAFEHVGDILRVPAYSELSPFLNALPAQQRYDLSDPLYEWLPQQTLGLLRASTAPRYVIYGYGQTLKPAPNGLVMSSGTPNYFGLVTNYQVTAETAVRAVVRVVRHATVNGTNYETVVESYNPLPPD